MVALRRDEDIVRLIALSPIAAIITDPRQADNPIIAANAAFEELTGYRLDEVVGRNCRFLQGPASEGNAKAGLRAAVATRSSTVVEITNYRKDGSSFRNAVMLAPILDEDGAARFFIGSQMPIASDGLTARREEAKRLIAGLPPRQREVLTEMARGLRHAEIAKVLGVTEKTVKMHRGALIKRLGCRTSAEAIRLAVEAGI